jgi:transposase-like protein
MTDQRMALLARLEQATSSTEPDVLRAALAWAIEELMEADVTERLGAGPHERTPERLGQRNGHRGRLFDSRVGALELAIPRLRSGSYFLVGARIRRSRSSARPWTRARRADPAPRELRQTRPGSGRPPWHGTAPHRRVGAT